MKHINCGVHGGSLIYFPPPSTASTVAFKPKEGRINFHCLTGRLPPKRKLGGVRVPLACLEEGCYWRRSAASYNIAMYHAYKEHGSSTLCMVVPYLEVESHNFKRQQRQVRSGESTPLIRLRLPSPLTFRVLSNIQGGGHSANKDEGKELSHVSLSVFFFIHQASISVHPTDQLIAGCLSDWLATARERVQSRSFVHFATEGNEPNQGNVHGVLWDRRPASLNIPKASWTSSRDGFIEVFADVKPTSEGAFRVAVALVNGLLQSGRLQGTPGVRLRHGGPLCTVRGVVVQV